ncbi:MAG TPA: hypothetical protein VHS31_06380 [Tepidisphaeraceae bacterium]|jgi:hypothetical protein|nr:hypothetical protein [Tepidisphaeraceae bacterium]
MPESIEIPHLHDPFLMELSVCGKIRTSKKATLSRLEKLDKGRMAARTYDYQEVSASVFAELFGGGRPNKNHLHVNLVIRPSKWQPSGGLASSKKLQNTISQFIGLGADLIIRGEFLLAVSKLAKASFIRVAMKERTIGGVKVERIGETFIAKPNNLIHQLKWSDFGNKHVLIVIDVHKSIKIGPDYLQHSKQLVLKAFRSIILVEKHDVKNSA